MPALGDITKSMWEAKETTIWHLNLFIMFFLFGRNSIFVTCPTFHLQGQDNNHRCQKLSTYYHDSASNTSINKAAHVLLWNKKHRLSSITAASCTVLSSQAHAKPTTCRHLLTVQERSAKSVQNQTTSSTKLEKENQETIRHLYHHCRPSFHSSPHQEHWKYWFSGGHSLCTPASTQAKYTRDCTWTNMATWRDMHTTTHLM